MAKQIKIGPLTINQDYLLLLLLAFLIIGLFITTLIVKNRQEIRSKAVVSGKVGLLLTADDNVATDSANPKIAPGMEFTVRVRYLPNLTNKQISGIETHLAYPADLLEIVGIPTIDATLFPTILQNKQSTGQIDLAAGIGVVQNCSQVNSACGTGVGGRSLGTCCTGLECEDSGNPDQGGLCVATPTRTPTPTQTPSPSPSPSPTIQAFRFTKRVYAETSEGNRPLVAGVIFATIKFKVKTDLPASANNITISFTGNPPQIVTVVGEASNAVDTASITNLSLPIEPISGTQPNLTFKIKFRSVNGDVGDQKVTIKTKKGNEVKEFKDITVKHGENGIYKAENVPLTGLIPGTYKIYVKGPKHLAKSFGEVELVNGTNTFGWAQAELEPGDTNPQDGVINSQDISRIVERLEVEEPSEDDLQVADLNYDGVINGGDINELIVTLGTKFDEDKY